MYLTSHYFINYKIINVLFGKSLTARNIKTVTVCKQTRSGRQFRKKMAVVVGDKNRHLGLGIKSSKQVLINI